MFEWLERNQALLGWMVVLSVVSLVLTAILLPIVVVRLPVDYFSGDPEHRHKPPRTFKNVAWHVLKNILGAIFALAGIAMLVLPGQGLLTIVIGILLMDLPGKYRFERWLISRPKVFRTINRLRARFDHLPLELDEAKEETPP